MNSSVVVCNIPKAGLGNQLFPLMHATVFATINRLPLIIIGYHQLKISPYIRHLKNKRQYKGYFKFQKSIAGEMIDRFHVWRHKKTKIVIFDPPVENAAPTLLTGHVFCFGKMPSYHNYFGQLHPHRTRVKELFLEMLDKEILQQLSLHESPIVGLHIRLGDFRKLGEGEIFLGGHVRAPEEYYLSLIMGIRNISEHDLPVTIFTDGYKQEVEKILQLPNVSLAVNKPDVADLVLLGKSKIIITAPGSTFSAWAAFLSDAAVLKYTDNFVSLRPEGSGLFEGVFNPNEKALTDYIKAINF